MFCKSICTHIPPTAIYCKVICRSTPPKATIVIQAANFPYIIQSFVQCVPPDPPSWPSLDTPKGRVPCNRHVHTHLKLSSNTPGYQVCHPLLEPKWLRKDINEYIYMDAYVYIYLRATLHCLGTLSHILLTLLKESATRTPCVTSRDVLSMTKMSN